MPNRAKPQIFVSACLRGQHVRYDGKHLWSSKLDLLSPVFEFIEVCPEVAIGLGVPRPPINLYAQHSRSPTHIKSSVKTELDVTQSLIGSAETAVSLYPQICGAVLTHKSPSCAVNSGKVYQEENNILLSSSASGKFAETVSGIKTTLPMIENVDLEDEDKLEHFVFAAYLYRDLHKYIGQPSSELIDFVEDYEELFDQYALAQFQINIESTDILTPLHADALYRVAIHAYERPNNLHDLIGTKLNAYRPATSKTTMNWKEAYNYLYMNKLVA